MSLAAQRKSSTHLHINSRIISARKRICAAIFQTLRLLYVLTPFTSVLTYVFFLLVVESVLFSSVFL